MNSNMSLFFFFFAFFKMFSCSPCLLLGYVANTDLRKNTLMRKTIRDVGGIDNAELFFIIIYNNLHFDFVLPWLHMELNGSHIKRSIELGIQCRQSSTF